MSYFDDASLVMIPSGYKDQKVYSVKPLDGSGDLTFSRASSATRVASNGLIEKVRTNYALRSQSFATVSVWSTKQGTITDNDGIAPDGTNTASKIVATNNDPYAYQSINLTGQVIASCYVKALGASIGQNATIVAAQSYSASFVMDGTWQRISVVGTAAGSQLYGIEAPNSGVSVGDSVLVWGFQVEYGDIATDYIATTSAAVSVGPVSGLPRLDYLNSTCPRLLLEPSRTNKCPSSSSYGNNLIDVTVSRNVTSAPTGYNEADRILDNNALGEHLLSENFDSITNGQAYTVSCFFKGDGTGGRGVIRYYGGEWVYAVYNLATGTVAYADANVTASIQNYGNGWYRCILTHTAVSDYTPMVTQIGIANSSNSFSYQGASNLGLYFFGFQAEQGAYATSYIPTLGTSVTRVADVAYKSSASALIGTTSGTAYISFVMDSDTSADSTTLLGLHYSTSTSNRIQVLSRFGTVRLLVVAAGSIITNAELYDAAPNELVNVAFTYGPAGVRAYVNGTQVYNTATAVSFNETFDLYTICNRSGIDEYGKGQRIAESLLFKNQVLTNAQLAELTTL